MTQAVRDTQQVQIFESASRGVGSASSQNITCPRGSRARVMVAKTAGTGVLDVSLFALTIQNGLVRLGTQAAVVTNIGVAFDVEICPELLRLDYTITTAAVTFEADVIFETHR